MYETRGFKSTNPYVTAPKTLDPAKVVVEEALGSTVPDTMRLPPRKAEPVPAKPPQAIAPLPLVRPGDPVRAEDINSMIRLMNMFTFETNIPQAAQSQRGGIVSGQMHTGPKVKPGRIITRRKTHEG